MLKIKNNLLIVLFYLFSSISFVAASSVPQSAITGVSVETNPVTEIPKIDWGEEVLEQKQPTELDNILLMELKDGLVVIEMYPKVAPAHVTRIKTLTREGFYNGLTFHRVIKGFMVQTGDPNGNGTGGSKYGPLYAEFNAIPHTRGIVSMARASSPDSANSQFFIVTSEHAKHLDGEYTVWGKVIQGMDLVDKIKQGSSLNNGSVENPDKIIKMVVAGDLNLASETKDDFFQELKAIEDTRTEFVKENKGKEVPSVLDIMLKM